MKVKYRYSSSRPITDFPITSRDTRKDAPVVIYEPPISDNPPTFLYIAGANHMIKIPQLHLLHWVVYTSTKDCMTLLRNISKKNCSFM